MPRLRRVSDGAGDSGSYYVTSKIVDGALVTGNGPPEVGVAITVGSATARSYSNQDYWSTTIITEILEHKDDYYRFKTLNSEYEFWGNG